MTNFFKSSPNNFFFLILEREKHQSAREISICRLSPMHRPGIQPMTWACALTRNQTCNLFGVWDYAQLTEPPDQAQI